MIADYMCFVCVWVEIEDIENEREGVGDQSHWFELNEN